MLLYTLDITSLYTNIPHDEGVQAIKELLSIHGDIQALPHNGYIIELLQVVLTNNYFDFNGKHYHHKNLELQGAPNWHPHMPICSCPNLNRIMFIHITYNPPCGKGSLMTFF